MTKPGDSLTTKKTIYELAKEFPNKIYKELEKYRNADRQEEAQQIITEQENEELKDNQHKEDWKKRAQEAEGELSILKGIETNRVKEAQARSCYLQDELDRVKKENNDLHNKVAALLDSVRPDDTDRLKKENNDLHKKVAALLDAVDPAVTIQKTRESGW